MKHAKKYDKINILKAKGSYGEYIFIYNLYNIFKERCKYINNG
jgi:hypothetical protein